MTIVLAAVLSVTTLVLAGPLTGPVTAQEDDDWPREFTTEANARVVVFQPQLDSLEGNRLSGRSAVSVTLDGADRPVFGAVWFDARIETDRDERVVEILDVQVPRVRFAEATPEQERQLAALLEKEVPKWDLRTSLDRILTALGVTEQQKRMSEGLNNRPPEILYRTSAAILVVIEDGPRLQAIEGTPFQHVVNSPVLMVKDPGNGTFFLYAAHDTWYTASSATGPFTVARTVPNEIVGLVPDEVREEFASGDALAAPPEIIVRTEAAELIVSDGAPEFRPVAGGELLFMTNTESDVLIEITTQRTFVLLSGRWFVAPSLDGPWSFVSPDALPAIFQAIEPDSEVAYLRASVAGTVEAQEAVLEAQIPQTAVISRDATLQVVYDGAPQFEPIQGTELSHAVNTQSQVLQHERRYYAVDNGVWFTADSPTGAWVVATSIPRAIYEQPASSPAYNTTFVYVYDSTPSVVHVGYLPGYMHSFWYRGCMMWGTGWHHPAWWGSHWWPRHSTWGFHMSWSSHGGWGFGTTWSSGWFSFSVGWSSWGSPSSGWWGPRGWPSSTTAFNAGWAQGHRSGFRAGYRAGTRDHIARGRNLYNRPSNRTRNAAAAGAAGGALAASARGGQPNNVFADRNGEVYRRAQDGGWQQRQQGQWAASGDLATAASGRAGQVQGGGDRAAAARDRASQVSPQRGTGGRANQPRSVNTSSLNRDFQARQRGAARTQSFRGGGRSSGGRRR